MWSGVFALGVAVVTMTAFAAWLTRRPGPDQADEDDFIPSADPDDPWSAYRPRPFQDMDRRRPRRWPAVTALVGLVLVGGGIAGARQSPTDLATPLTDPTPRPYMIEVGPDVVPSVAPVATEATPEATPAATPAGTPAPQAAAPTPAPAATPQPTAPADPPAGGSDGEPTVTASATCQGGTLEVSYSITSGSAKLAWLAVYVDGEVTKGGPISGDSHSGSYQQPAESGDHDVEVVAEDSSGASAAKRLGLACP